MRRYHRRRPGTYSNGTRELRVQSSEARWMDSRPAGAHCKERGPPSRRLRSRRGEARGALAESCLMCSLLIAKTGTFFFLAESLKRAPAGVDVYELAKRNQTAAPRLQKREPLLALAPTACRFVFIRASSIKSDHTSLEKN